ncbi:unnamed protein product [Microthlaspi erraticum]|uniref:Uncharacterized protein n=1 Tax=Microthlaspi erraticum TaxID=1685480 RepID=A0A6D2JBU8_9BRAS|nr:unnamed protein product [Microthlaspi erraticum]
MEKTKSEIVGSTAIPQRPSDFISSSHYGAPPNLTCANVMTVFYTETNSPLLCSAVACRFTTSSAPSIFSNVQVQKLLKKKNNREACIDLMTPSPLVPEERTNQEEAAKLLLCTTFYWFSLFVVVGLINFRRFQEVRRRSEDFVN